MKKIITFGENAEGYSIPVLNEREIRAAAGIMFLAITASIFLIAVKGDLILIKYVVTFFLADFIIRVFINPKFSPSLILGRLIVSNQVPEYVGARPKKFAWFIGVVLSAIMFIFLVILNTTNLVTIIGCLLCIVFLFFETAFGICIGCNIYRLVYKNEAQYCPGEICDPGSKHEIQKVSGIQLLILLGVFLLIFLFSVSAYLKN